MALPRPFAAWIFPLSAAASLAALSAGPASAQQAPSGQRPLENPPPPPAALSQPSSEQKMETPRKRLRFGPEVGLYLPTNSRTRDRFGSAWTNVGFGIGSIADIHRNSRLALDISFISNARGEQKVFLAPIGLAYSIGLGKQGASTAAYAGVSADLVIASIRSDRDNLPSRTSTGGGASIFLGTRFSESGYLEARYNAIAKIRSFDLSGLNLSAGYRF